MQVLKQYLLKPPNKLTIEETNKLQQTTNSEIDSVGLVPCHYRCLLEILVIVNLVSEVFCLVLCCLMLPATKECVKYVCAVVVVCR